MEDAIAREDDEIERDDDGLETMLNRKEDEQDAGLVWKGMSIAGK